MRLVVLILTVTCLLGIWWVWRLLAPGDVVDVPDVDLTGFQAPVVERIEESLQKVREDSQSAEAWGELGKVLLANRLPAESREAFQQASKFSPDDYRWAYYHAYTFLETDTQEALAGFQKACRLNPDYLPAILRLAELGMRLGQFELSRESLKQAQSRYPQNPFVLMLAGRLALIGQEYVEAEKLFLQAAETPGWVPSMAYHELAALAHHQGNYSRSLEYRNLLEQYPNVAPMEFPDPLLSQLQKLDALSKSLAKEADLALARGDLRKAIGLYESFLKKREKIPTAMSNLGNAYAFAGDYSAAIQIYRDCLQNFPNYLPARIGLAATFQQMGDFPKALKEYESILELKPDHSQAWFQIGFIHEQQGNFDRAIESYQTLTNINPSSPQAYLALAVILVELQRYSEASGNLARAKELAPGDPVVLGLEKELKDRAKVAQ